MKKQFWTLRYALINITYFMTFCTIHAYAAVYLLDKGFSNTQIGILLAVANVLSAVSQPVLASIIDKPDNKLTNRIAIILSSGVIVAASFLLIFVDKISLLVFILYTIIYMVNFVYQPVITALYFEYEKAGCNIMYGLARGLGSAGFAVTSAIIGNAVEHFGVTLLLVTNIVVVTVSAGIVFFFKKPKEDTLEETDETEAILVKTEADTADNDSKNLKGFVKAYPSFVILVIGVACLFFAHNMINDFLIQIITPVGGGEREMGYATSLAALLELPMMASIGILLKKFTPGKMLVFSAAAFTVKTIIMAFAVNLTMMYISMACQFFAYALFIPASAHFVNRLMAERDQVKGQAYITSAITIGGVFSTLICGRVLDVFGSKIMMSIGCVVSAIGLIIVANAIIKSSKVMDNSLYEE